MDLEIVYAWRFNIHKTIGEEEMHSCDIGVLRASCQEGCGQGSGRFCGVSAHDSWDKLKQAWGFDIIWMRIIPCWRRRYFWRQGKAMVW